MMAGAFCGEVDAGSPRRMRPDPESRPWRIAPDVLWRHWDGEVAAYSGATGDTHHVADIAAFLFRVLAQGEASEEALCDAALREVELPAAIDRGAAIRRSLALLERLSLIEAAW